MKKFVFAIIVNLVFSLCVYAETSLWKVVRGNSVAYIGGTCHVLRPSDYPLPVEFTKAYKDAHMLVFETQIDALKSPETQAMIVAKGMYGADMGLETVLSQQTYDNLKGYCQALGVPVASMNRLKPPLVVLTLIGLELKKLGVREGVDQFYFAQAKKDGKKIDALESANEQIAFILSMGVGREDEFIEHSIRDLKKTSQIIDQLISAWKGGQEQELYALFVAEMKRDYPDLYKALLVDRNRAWFPKIEGFLHTPEKELVLVGVGHLVGRDGIIESLRSHGYQVTKVTVH
jgi:uncharacterized protein YbaP (TraB family)